MVAGRKSERLDILERAIGERGVLHLREAARLLGVSEMTVRRDIDAQSGRFGFFGGHIMTPNGDAPYELKTAADSHTSAKRAASTHAIGHVRAEETIFIDCGTTLIHLADMLPGGMPLTVVCYALNVAERLARNPAIRLIVLGGLYHPASASFSGEENRLDEIGINTAFISAAGIDEQRGATCAHFHEAAVKRKAIALAQRSILVADSSKLGRIKPTFFAGLEQFEMIVTEAGRWEWAGKEQKA